MENKFVRITFLDFRKAFDLIDHNRLLQNFNGIGVRQGKLDDVHRIYKGDHR